ncbi:uncharacterized protein UTRI_06545 [Ustilago trichophora]|uniref:Uncharacterized protein n=1 Tax=Ustilago trichophora TaxID=86804 RepID=A0A5C3EMU1_9BASI|nr:uncharacterized protein UTRI_06545 [Ustilago trichophora]
MWNLLAVTSEPELLHTVTSVADLSHAVEQGLAARLFISAMKGCCGTANQPATMPQRLPATLWEDNGSASSSGSQLPVPLLNPRLAWPTSELLSFREAETAIQTSLYGQNPSSVGNKIV